MSRTRLDDQFAAQTEAMYDQFIAANGQPFENGIVVAKNLGPQHECWSNARARANKNPKLRYAEGYVLLPEKVAHRHAFCVDKRGTVIEVTAGYENALSYGGMVLNLEAVNEIHRIERLIYDQAKDHPLMSLSGAAEEQEFMDVSALQMALWSSQQGEPGSKEMLEMLVGLRTDWS